MCIPNSKRQLPKPRVISKNDNQSPITSIVLSFTYYVPDCHYPWYWAPPDGTAEAFLMQSSPSGRTRNHIEDLQMMNKRVNSVPPLRKPCFNALKISISQEQIKFCHLGVKAEEDSNDGNRIVKKNKNSDQPLFWNKKNESLIFHSNGQWSVTSWDQFDNETRMPLQVGHGLTVDFML